MAKKESKEKPARTLKVVSGSRNGGGRAGGGNGDSDDGVDFESVRALARIATEFDLEEIEVSGAGHLRVRRAVAGGALVGAPSSMARPIALTPPVDAKPPEGAGTFVSSPFVGTFYRAPSPEAPVFVEVGQAVRKGQVVCIVEAMKLMNEIEAETDGKVEEILVKNGEHVEYGQHLIRLAKS
jgi:acetyl-CoA carboxylase biotin carboxyl carrier protein